MPSKNQKIGKWGENKACIYLQKHEYKIIERNFHASNLGEIDIVAKKNNKYIFIEVKTKRNEHFGLPEEELTDGKKEKLEFAILYYLETHSLYDVRWRLDLVAIEVMKNKIQLRHYKYVN